MVDLFAVEVAKLAPISNTLNSVNAYRSLHAKDMLLVFLICLCLASFVVFVG